MPAQAPPARIGKFAASKATTSRKNASLAVGKVVAKPKSQKRMTAGKRSLPMRKAPTLKVAPMAPPGLINR